MGGTQSNTIDIIGYEKMNPRTKISLKLEKEYATFGIALKVKFLPSKRQEVKVFNKKEDLDSDIVALCKFLRQGLIWKMFTPFWKCMKCVQKTDVNVKNN